MAQIDRADRAAQETVTRRRRDDGAGDAYLDLKLSVPDAIRAKYPDRIFRWANDVGARLHNLTVRDDWDKVDGIDPRPVGSDKDGHPILAHLLSKPRAFQAEDEAKKEARRREIEKAQVNGFHRAREDDVAEEHRYVPKGNRIGATS